MISWIYKLTFERVLGKSLYWLDDFLDGKKTLIGAVLTAMQLAYYLIAGPGSHYDSQYQALMTLLAEHGHYGLLTETAVFTVVGIIDKIRKLVRDLIAVGQEAGNFNSNQRPS